jgi:hypothetical protein
MKRKKNLISAVIAIIAMANVCLFNILKDNNSENNLNMLMRDAQASSVEKVTCEEDPGDTCMVGDTPVPDYDEKK